MARYLPKSIDLERFMNSMLNTSVCHHIRWRPLITFLGFLALLICSGAVGRSTRTVRAAVTIQNSTPVITVSAASYVGSPGALAPNSIVAAFGTQLAPGVEVAPSIPLPTTIRNTRVLVNNVPAQLFFVSPNQINYLIPENTPAGDTEVVVSTTLANGDQVVSRGQLRIAPTAPALFTADASGTGAPAALVGRIGENGQFGYDASPPYRPDPVTPGRLIPAPIDAGSETRPAFLVLYGTGLRNAQPSSIRGVIGGLEIPVDYFGAVANYAGLDQINLRLPHTLKGRGLVELRIVVNGASSNPITLDLAGAGGQALAISGFGVTSPALAGQTITIRGNGFSAKADDNVVRFGPAQARVIASTSNQLTVIVPFGAQSGQVTVQTNQIEARSIDVFKVKTSISGIIQSTGSPLLQPSPLSNVTVRLAGTNISVRTTPQGTFVLSDIPPGVSLVEIDGGTTTANPPFPAVTLKLAARADRDNQIAQPISLQQINGASANVGGVIGPAGLSSLSILRMKFVDALIDQFWPPGQSGTGSLSSVDPASLPPLAQFAPLEKVVKISNRGVSIEVPFGTAVRFPDGKSSGQIQLTVLEGTRLPGITIPSGINPESVAQITPLGARFQPGASISFPNPDQQTLRPGDRVPLYRYEATTGSFIRRGSGVVTPDGSRIDSDGRAVDMASFWMVGTTAQVTTVTGRVIDLQGQPISGARVSVNGRTGLTDLNGGFTISDVAATANNRLQAEAIVPQQFGITPQGSSGLTPVVVGGVTNVGTIALSNTRQAGLVLSPFTIDLPANTSAVPVNVTLTEPAPAGGLVVSVISENSAVVSVPGTITIPAGQTTTLFNVGRVGPGAARIDARAVLRNASIESSAVVSVALPGPVLSASSPVIAPIGGRITITGTGLHPIPSNHFVSFLRNNELLAILNPSENEIALDSTGQPALRVRIPAIAPGPVAVAVAVIDPASGVISENSAPIQLTISDLTVPAPSLALSLPGEGRPRDRITIIGSGFSAVRHENQVFFAQSGLGGQSGLSVQGQVIEASPTSLTVAIPALGINRGNLKITARRIDASGATSENSNAINFTVTSDPVAPSTPILTTVANISNGAPSGKDGDRIRASGKDFGYSFFSTQNILNTVDPIVTLVVFTQNREFINFSVPLNALGGNQIETIVPSGLKKGVAEVTVFNFDTETGRLSEESAPLTFNVTEGSDFRLNEDEPNDSPDLATKVYFPVTVEGRIAAGDWGSLTMVFENNNKVVLADLFSLKLDVVIRGTITLTFNQGADLDLFLLRRNSQGRYDRIDSSNNIEGTVESLTLDLVPGEYLLGIGSWSGSSPYRLSLQFANGTSSLPALRRWAEVVEGQEER